MTSATAKSSEPTIDDILASIRRIIADDQQAEPPPAPTMARAQIGDASDDVLDLAQPVVRPSGISKSAPVQPVSAAPVQPEAVIVPPQPAPTLAASEPVISNLRPKPAEVPPVVTPKPASTTERPAAMKRSSTDGERLQKLIAGEAEEALSAAFGRISALRVSAETRTLEGLVAELLRPMLKDWLDANLPAIAERLVKQEIERIAAQSGR